MIPQPARWYVPPDLEVNGASWAKVHGELPSADEPAADALAPRVWIYKHTPMLLPRASAAWLRSALRRRGEEP